MKAKYVFEKFKEESDPVKDLGIGFSKRTLNSKSWKVLDFIKSKGEEGASLKEIQYFIWILNGNDPQKFFEKSPITVYDQKTDDYSIKMARRTRGYWTTNLLGGGYNHKGLLYNFCRKNPTTKKWVFVRYPKSKEIIYHH